jgi:hypothetical protein
MELRNRSAVFELKIGGRVGKKYFERRRLVSYREGGRLNPAIKKFNLTAEVTLMTW